MRSSILGSGTSRAAAQVGGGALVIGVALLCVAFGSRLAPHDPFQYNPRDVFEGPSARYLFGTDPLGRDVLSQIIAGATAHLPRRKAT